MADYWTPAFPNGAANAGYPAGMSQYTYETGGFAFRRSCYDWCDCGFTSHMLDTQSIHCSNLQYSTHSTGNYQGSWNPVTVPNPLTNLWTYERDWIYDSCLNACVTTTACTVENKLSFSGGCIAIAGTGYTNTSVFSALTDCELVCGSGDYNRCNLLPMW